MDIFKGAGACYMEGKKFGNFKLHCTVSGDNIVEVFNMKKNLVIRLDFGF